MKLGVTKGKKVMKQDFFEKNLIFEKMGQNRQKGVISTFFKYLSELYIIVSDFLHEVRGNRAIEANNW